MPRSFQDIIDHAEDLADAFEAYEPRPEDDTTTPEMLLRRAAWKRAQAERAIVEAVVGARDDGVPWTTIGVALGTSGQAAQKRYSAVVSLQSKTSKTKSPKKAGRSLARNSPPPRPAKRAATPASPAGRRIAAKGRGGLDGTRRPPPATRRGV